MNTPFGDVSNRPLENPQIMPRETKHDVARATNKPTNRSSRFAVVNVRVLTCGKLATATLALACGTID